MHELSCPGCNAPSQYDLHDYQHMCPFCSVTFSLDMETGKKEIYSDHYIVANACDSRLIKDLVTKWLKRLHHNPATIDKEFYIIDINGFSIPFWIVSLEAHTAWKGLVKRQNRSQLDMSAGSGYIMESGQFRRNYRWAVSARKNICEHWGMTMLHEPKEAIEVEWDGFPLDSTYSRGRLDSSLGIKKTQGGVEEELSAYDIREYFEFKYANGLPILNIQVGEAEALRRAKLHVELYHYKLGKLNVDIPIDMRTELEIAGIQLIHLPFWHIHYVYRPNNLLKHIQNSAEKNVIIEGYSGGVLKGELAMVHGDKLWINAIICALASLVLFFMGFAWHPAFLLVAFFGVSVAIGSAYVASTRKPKREDEDSSFFGTSSDSLKITKTAATPE